jgi:uncharacterized phosphosugar-binding protein
VSAGVEYLRRVTGLLDDVAAKQELGIDQAATLMARTISLGGLVHLFGSAHSMLPVLEVFPRYGSFVGLHPLIDPRLLWFNVLGSGGVPEMLYIQNTEGYARVFLDGQGLRQRDVLIIFSHGGTSPVVVDAAKFAREHGLSVVAVMSRPASEGASARHSSGETLLGLADVLLDTGVPREDGLIAVDGFSAPVGAGSTVIAMSIGLALVAACAEKLAAEDFPVIQSIRAERDEHLAYGGVYRAYEESLHRSDGS